MSWLEVKTFFGKLWSFVRRYGWIIILVVAMIAMGVLTMGSTDVISSMWRLIRNERDIHKQRVKELDEIQEREMKAREKAAKRAVDAVKQAEAQFQEKNRELDKRTRKQVEKLAHEHSEDPVGLGRRLASQFGIVYMPTEEE